MAQLTGNAISASYNGLLKSDDNAALGATEKNITDGDGNATTLSLGTASASFTGTLDLTGATVLGGGGGGMTGVSETTVQIHAGPDTADTVYYELLIPANTFAAGDIVQMSAIARQNFGGSGWIYDAAWINASTGSFPGDVAIGGHANSSSPGAPYAISWYKTLYIHTSDGTGDGTSIYSSDSPIEQESNGSRVYMDQAYASIDWTANQYFAFSAYVDNAGSQIELLGVNVTKVNA